MHLKSCCALLLLALVACQAAPSTFKNIEKKSISEKMSKIEKDNLKMEDPGTDKDRAKKSTTTFCIEVRDGKQHEVPCSELKQPVLLVQPELPKQPVIQHPPAKLLNYPIRISEVQTPAQVVQVQPQQLQIAPLSQPIQVVQPVVPQLVVPQPVAPQPQSPPVYNFPTVQPPVSPQAPIVNILTPPATPCNVAPTPIVIQQDHVPLKEVEHPKPIPKQPQFEQLPNPISFPQRLEVLSVAEPAPCKQDLVVLPSKSLALYPEKQVAVQVAELEPQPISGGECLCNQKGHPHASWYRHHPKVHEHHVMLHPAAIAPTTPLVVQPPCPMSYLSNNHQIFGQYV